MTWLQSRGADPTILSEDFEPYLNPGKKSPVEVAIDDEDVRGQLRALEKLYADTPKCQEPHPDIGCWQTLYDYGPDVVKFWAKDYKHPYPGIVFTHRTSKTHTYTSMCKAYKALHPK